MSHFSRCVSCGLELLGNISIFTGPGTSFEQAEILTLKPGLLNEEPLALLREPRLPKACPDCEAHLTWLEITDEAMRQQLVHMIRTLQATAVHGVLAIKAIIIPGEKTPAGGLVEAVAPAWFEIIQYLEADPEWMYHIDHRRWEEILAGAYEAAGFDEVILTPRSGDFGRDVIAVKKGHWGVRILDQMKAYKPGHLVTANDVRAMLGVITGDQNTSKGVVTTTADFAPGIKDDPLIKPYLPYRIELVNGTQLVDHLTRIARIR